jgi:Trypsin-like peptidase domain
MSRVRRPAYPLRCTHRRSATAARDVRGFGPGRGRRPHARDRQPTRAALQRDRGHRLRRWAQRARNDSVTLSSVIQTSAPINPGNSGGAVVDLNGQVLGIPTLAALDPEMGAQASGIGFAIDGNTVRQVAHTLVRSS